MKITITEYARRKGCSRTAVYKAIAAGRIDKGLIVEGENKFIDPDVADAEWVRNHNPAYERTTKSGGKTVNVEKTEEQQPTIAPNNEATLAAAKRAHAVFKAKMAELEYKEKLGTLVDKKQVYDSLFAFGKELRTAVLGVPERVIDGILAADNRHDAFSILYDELVNVLEALSDIDKRPLTSDR